MVRHARWMMAVTMGLVVAACSDEPAPQAPSTPAASAPVASPAAAETAAPAEAPKTVAELLDAARTSMREQRLIQPPGNNAIEQYLEVLKQEPDNRQAQLAILELMPLAQGVAEQMIDTRRLDEAATAVALLKRAQPDSVVVTTLEQRIVNERRAEEQRLQAEEERTRLAEQRQREEAEAARQAAAAPPPAAAPATSTARATPTTTTTVPPAREAEPAPAPVTPPPAATPAAQLASATPTPSVAAGTAPNKDFSLLRRVNPDYPSQALRSRTEGWVELSFTITATGDVENVAVVNANPRRVFDREAIRALSQWKFNPRVEGGRPVSAKARQRLEFSLD